jgi:ATP-dependent DNA helicase UvrD/PcrA
MKSWSPYQDAVFRYVEDPSSRHLVVEALAGSGKSTTIEESVFRTRAGTSVAVMAFNKPIADDMRLRLPDEADVMTLNSFGFKAVRGAFGNLDVGPVVPNLVKGILGDKWATREARQTVIKLVELGKSCLADSIAELDEVADEYGVAFPKDWERDRLIHVADKVLDACMTPGRTIDFDDQIWLPHVLGLEVPLYDWIFVDELQDMNRAQLELVYRGLGASGRFVGVGDRRQSIYQFRGADHNAIPQTIERLGAKVLPLSITYRCPLAVVREAQKLVPQLEAAPNAIEGIVRDTDYFELIDDAQPGDFVVSRTNAQLLSLCWRWLSQGRKAAIKGRDIGSGLAMFVRDTRATRVSELLDAVESWRHSELRRLIERGRDTSAVDDKAECIHVLAEGCKTIDEVVAKIDRLFTDDGTPGILLSSTHRAKGLEADRVWLLRDTFLRWDGPEEKNLLYVATTRAKQELIYCYDESPDHGT